MSIISRVVGLLARRSRQTAAADLGRRGMLVFGRPAAGVWVDERNALTYSAVWSAVRVIAESIASMPWRVIMHASGARHDDRDHPVWWMLNREPNPEMDAFSLREAMTAHMLLAGNAYAEIERDRAGRPIALWPIAPDIVDPRRDQTGRLVYRVSQRGGDVDIPAHDILHVHGLGYDGLIGYSVVSMARESIALGLTTERYGASFFGSGSRPGGVLKHPHQLDDDARTNLRESWEQIHAGPANAHKIAILEEGMEWQQLGVPPGDAQFLESRKFQVAEIARWFRVPLHMLGDLERATFSNIEHQSIEFVRQTLLPWARRWEHAVDRRLFGRVDQGRRYTRLNLDAMLRGDTRSRYDAYRVALSSGWLSVNEVRDLEDRDPVEHGDEYLRPLNMTPLGTETMDDAARPAADMDDPLMDQARRLAGIERDRLTRLLRRAGDQSEPVRAWWAAHRSHVAESLGEALADAWCDSGLAACESGMSETWAADDVVAERLRRCIDASSAE